MVARSRGLGGLFVAGSSSATLGEGAPPPSEARTRSDDARRDEDDRTRVADGEGDATRAAPAGRGGTRGEARREARAFAAAKGRAVGVDAARATERTVMAVTGLGYPVWRGRDTLPWFPQVTSARSGATWRRSWS